MAENAGKNTFFLRVIAADRVFFKGKCTYVVLPAVDGEHAIMAHHSDMMIATVTVTIRFQTEDGAWQEAVIGTGFTQVINNRVTILVEFAERPEEIDALRAREAKERAEEQLRQKQSLQEYYHTQASLARAMARLRLTNKNNINRK